MSQPHYGRDMERTSGSVRRARERVQASGRVPASRRAHHKIVNEDDSAGNLNPAPRHHLLPSNPPPPPPPDPQSPRSPHQRNASGGSEGSARLALTRPTQSPQWPLSPNSPLAAVESSESHRSPTGHRHQNPTPGRQGPRRTPSDSSSSDDQEPIPVYLQDGEDDQRRLAGDSQPSSSTDPSARHKSPSAGSVPQFPEPSSGSALPPVPPKRSLNLGPPPSSRRGASSYYSHNSFVPPIPEENSRSVGSYASSAAIPRRDSWGSISPLSSPIEGDGNRFYESSVKSKDSGLDEIDLNDESKLVRSASIGKKGKASLVDNKGTPSVRSASVGSILIARPSPTPVQMPFGEGTGYVDASTSSSDNTLHLKKVLASTPEGRKGTGKASSPESRLDVPAGQMPSPRMGGPGQLPASGRLSGMRRPPRLDIDAVRDMEARGSLTSLPDLIQRATRLAAMIDKGKRPGSRFDLNDYSVSDRPSGSANDRVQSGLSDMLAAFPPPAQPTPTGRQSRGSWFRHTAWPKAENQGQEYEVNDQSGKVQQSEKAPNRPARRCCGMPPWLCVLVIVLLIAIIAVAIAIPLQFFVFKNLGNHQTPEASLDKCKSELPCQNGGTNVFNDNVCSCLCTNGYTGHDCSTKGSEGCTTTNLVSSSSSSTINNVTLGSAIPRLIVDSNNNFSIPLSGTTILAKINSGDLSCRTQNALVTFQGRSSRVGETSVKVTSIGADANSVQQREESQTAVPTTTSRVGNSLVITDSIPLPTKTAAYQPNLQADLFNVTEDALDFARVAVLYVLQEQNSSEAVNAQSYLQRFFTRASSTEIDVSYATQSEARKVDIGTNSTINLVDFRLNLGMGSIGK